MAEVQQIDHVQEGVDKLPSQWGDKYDVNDIDWQHPPTIAQRLLQSFLGPLNGVEQKLFDIRESFNLYTAVGNQLDILGTIRDVKRNGRDDTSYRKAILLKISASSGSGTIEDISNLLSGITGSDVKTIFEHYPLGYISYTASYPFYNVPSDIEEASAAGVDGYHVIFDPNQDCFAPADITVETYDLVTEDGDTIIDDAGDTIVVNSAGGSLDPFNRSAFPDSSEPVGFRPLPTIGGLDSVAVDGVGYGMGYGLSYGGTP